MIKKLLLTTKLNSYFYSVALVTVAFVAQGVVLGFTVLLPFVQVDFQLTRAQLGLYPTFLFFSSFVMALFSGWIVDYFGTKRILVTGVFLLGLFMFLHSFIYSYPILLFFAFFTGLGHSMVTPATNKIIVECIPIRNRTIAMGIAQSGEGMGIILSSVILTIIAIQYNWRSATICSGFFTLMIAFLLWQRYQKKKSVQKKRIIDLEQIYFHFKENIKNLLKNRYLLSISILGFAFGIASSSTITHLVLFLNHDLGFSTSMSGIGLGILQVGGIVGLLFWGLVKDRIYKGYRSKNILFWVGSVIAIFSVLFAYVVIKFALSPLLIAGCIFLLGNSNLGWTGIIISSATEIVDQEYSGTAIGLVLFLVRFGLLLGPPIFGLIADYYGYYKYSWYFLGSFVFIIVIIFFLLAGKYENEHRQI